MKIVEVIPQLASGGAERFTVDLCNELSKNNEVILIVLSSIDDRLGFYVHELYPNVKLISLNKKRGISLKIMLKLYKLIKKESPNVVHTHLHAVVYCLWSRLMLRNIPFFYTLHSDAKRDMSKSLMNYIKRYMIHHNLVRVITISPENNRGFNEWYKQKATMIFNGRNVDKNLVVSHSVKEEIANYNTCNGRILILLAHLDDNKRQVMVAKIVQKLNQEGYRFTMLFIGGAQRTDLVAEINSYQNSNLFILGTRQNPLEYLKCADAFCLASKYEGMPISLIEALGVGIVPVCTPVGGIVDVVEDGLNGILSKDITEESYYNALKKFLDMSDEEVSVMKKNSFASYAPLSMSQCAEKYMNLFKQHCALL